MSSGKHSAKRRKLGAPALAWELMDRAARAEFENDTQASGWPKHMINWAEWARGVLAVAVSDALRLRTQDVVGMFDGDPKSEARLLADLRIADTTRLARLHELAQFEPRLHPPTKKKRPSKKRP